MDRKEENIALDTKQIIRRCILKEKKKEHRVLSPTEKESH